jgi:OMF family outer membrane factor
MKLVNIRKQIVLGIVFILFQQSMNAQILTLQKCLDSAKVNNKNLKISKNNTSISSQKQKEVIANLYPKVTANADYKYFIDLPTQLMPATIFGGPAGTYKTVQFGVPHNINTNLQLTMPLYNPQLNGAINASKVANEIAQLNYQKTEEQLYFDITNLYYNAQLLQIQLGFIENNLINSNKLLKNIQLLKDNLMAKTTDVNKVQLQVDQLITQKELAINKFNQFLNLLKFSIGIPISSVIEIDKSIAFNIISNYQKSETIDIQIIKTQNKLLKTELNTLKNSKILPTLNFVANYGYMGLGQDKKPNNFLDFYTTGFAGIQFSYPLFNGTITNKKMVQKKYEIENSELQNSLATDQNAMQIENTTQQLVANKRAIDTADKQIKLAQEVCNQTVLQQKQGVASLTDVLQTDNSLREAQQNYLSIVIDYLKADLELKKLSNQLKN